MTSPKSFGGLGFRDMGCFNQALLARQAWRLLTTPDSLCARVLKARYYPNESLMDTAFPRDSSASWKGIEYGLELLKRGVVWRVGNGQSIKIWRHCWVPHEEKLIQIQKKNWNRALYVKELWKHNEKAWDEQMVRHLLKPEDAEVVLRIKIPQ
jgi:hypothetical protein